MGRKRSRLAEPSRIVLRTWNFWRLRRAAAAAGRSERGRLVRERDWHTDECLQGMEGPCVCGGSRRYEASQRQHAERRAAAKRRLARRGWAGA